MADTTPPSSQASPLDPTQLQRLLPKAVSNASDLAETLRHISVHLDDSLMELFLDASPQDLRKHAAIIQACTLHALHTIASLQLAVGKLTTIAQAANNDGGGHGNSNTQ